MREFLDDDERMFSSYAELVGLTRGLDLAFEARKGMTITNAPTICANADAAVTAWRSLLHPSKKEIVREDGTVDELLFKASIIIQTYVSVTYIRPYILTTTKSDTSSISTANSPPLHTAPSRQ